MAWKSGLMSIFTDIQTGPPTRRAWQWSVDIWNDFRPIIDDLQLKMEDLSKVEEALRRDEKACSLKPYPFHPNIQQISYRLRTWRKQSRQSTSQSMSGREEEGTSSEDDRDDIASKPEPEPMSNGSGKASTPSVATGEQAKSPVMSDIDLAAAEPSHWTNKTYQYPVATESVSRQSNRLADGVASSRSNRSDSLGPSLDINSGSTRTFEDDIKEEISEAVRLDKARMHIYDSGKAPSTSTGSILGPMAVPEIRQGITSDNLQFVGKCDALGRGSSLSSDTRDFHAYAASLPVNGHTMLSNVARGFLNCLPHLPGNCLRYIKERPQLLQEDYGIFLKVAEEATARGGPPELIEKSVKCYHYLQKHANLTQTTFAEWMGSLQSCRDEEDPTIEQLKLGKAFSDECDATNAQIREKSL